MPWRYNFRRRRWGRRRYYRRWRTGGFVRPRRYRRRNWVRRRPKKLKKITLREWQPSNIRKCHIKGLCCIVYVNEKRLSWNSTLYENSITPELQPGGGGFGVMMFTLDNLYSMHRTCNNWWTASNENLPLTRYKGCKLTLYQSDTIDYVINISTQHPMVSNKLSYPGCQPAMLMMNRYKIIMPSRQTNPRKKSKKTIFIHPPAQFQNKWYFQKEIATKPLMVIHAAPTTLYHHFINTQSESNSISITHLNTKLITNRNFAGEKYKTEHWPYKIDGTRSFYFYRYTGNLNPNQPGKFLVKQLCPLTNSIYHKEGETYEEAKTLDNTITPQKYTQDLLLHRGNIFTKHAIQNQDEIWYTQISPQTMFNNFTETTTIEQQSTPHMLAFAQLTEPLFTYTRYNPNTDDGTSTNMFLLPNNKPEIGWEKPADDALQLGGFPLWINIFGFVDFQIRLQKLINVQQNHILCFQTDRTKPLYNYTFVPIDISFLNDQSPYLTYLKPEDAKTWYPQVQYQVESINNITKSGPGIARLPNKQSEEIKVKYDFLFNWGGNPAKMVTVDNPIEQTVYPIPRNEHEKPSLQSPAQAFESVLYTFDQRKYQLTQQALKRISKDWGLKETLSPITEPTRAVPVQQTLQALLQETETQEESEEALLQQLQYHQQQQLQLKHRIMDLLAQMQT
nr:MAG: ORF1 [TTV-like mini virus]